MTRSDERARPLAIEIGIPTGATLTEEDFPVRVRFTNRGETVVYVLDQFEPVPVFFSFQLVRPDGTPVPIPGAGKADFGPESPGTIALSPGESAEITVQLAPWIGTDLPAGTYTLSATYHNQYGDACFRGTLSAPPRQVQMKGACS